MIIYYFPHSSYNLNIKKLFYYLSSSNVYIGAHWLLNTYDVSGVGASVAGRLQVREWLNHCPVDILILVKVML